MREKVRICATIPAAKGLENWGPIHEELLAEIAHDGVEVVMVDLPDAPVTAISSNYDADLVALLHVEAALRAEEEGFDAVAMGCLLEPGVSAAKEVVQIPVVGEAGAAMHMAALVAPRFSFVGTGTRQSESRIRGDIVRQYGLTDHLASVRGVGASSLAFAGEEEGLAELMIREARLAVEEDGAQAIISYGSLKILRALREALPVPIIEPVTAGILVAEMLVRGRLSQSKVAFVRPSMVIGRS